jgi:hypothetical protein
MRFTVRRLMVLIAVAALLMAGSSWMGHLARTRASRLARLELLVQLEGECRALGPGKGPISSMLLRDGEHLPVEEAIKEVVALRRRYEYAAAHPWLPIPSQ